MKKIYIAGPQVFLPDPAAHFTYAADLCARLGVQALIPYDPLITTLEAIYNHNVQLLREADGLVADILPFRGSEPDSGTCWELGWMAALGKPCAVYSFDRRALGTKQLRYFRALGYADPLPGAPLPDQMLINKHPISANLMLLGGNVFQASQLEEALCGLVNRLND